MNGLLAYWCPVDERAMQPLQLAQAQVAARLALNELAHRADAPIHDALKDSK